MLKNFFVGTLPKRCHLTDRRRSCADSYHDTYGDCAMPYTVNGFGTHVCGSRGDVGWGSQDAMEWIVIFFMPVIPIKAVHTFDWKGNQYRAIPITWSFDLTIRTFLGGWVWGFGLLGAV